MGSGAAGMRGSSQEFPKERREARHKCLQCQDEEFRLYYSDNGEFMRVLEEGRCNMFRKISELTS